jgi:GNAT superfamily N-acetyltransferase
VSAHPPRLIEPSERDVDGLIALSQSARWNQNRDDWLWMLRHGRTRALVVQEQLVASTLVLPWKPPSNAKPLASTPESLAWISMVLVLPEHRGKGYATQLLREALGWLAEPGQQHLTPMLDATPAGHPVYLKLGFRDLWAFTRWERSANCDDREWSVSSTVLNLASLPSDHPHHAAMIALDRTAFGADREPLLNDLLRRAPQLALAVCDRDTLKGFVLARPGRRATQLGPLVAQDEDTAITLAKHALSSIDGPVFVDVPDAQQGLASWLHQQGLTVQRAFTRMALNPTPGSEPIGYPSAIFAVAGPELG